ncbi:hypothetical protein GCM10022255_036140 [Dactylosporangium darangshiense]|uniref:Uncharacterized protein n=1 Tax=Dactylosporangium darangshiense TaxID=579108 RepID=A0ABP8D8E8_9ACTN
MLAGVLGGADGDAGAEGVAEGDAGGEGRAAADIAGSALECCATATPGCEAERGWSPAPHATMPNTNATIAASRAVAGLLPSTSSGSPSSAVELRGGHAIERWEFDAAPPRFRPRSVYMDLTASHVGRVQV